MNILQKKFEYQMTGKFHFVDITEDVVKFLASTGLQQGLVTVYSPHTTTAIKINEDEDGFRDDFTQFMKKLVPADAYYKHNDLEIRAEHTLCEDRSLCINGDSHILQMLIGTTSETVPFHDGKLQLGRWQRIFLIELDKKRPRHVLVQVMGQ